MNILFVRVFVSHDHRCRLVLDCSVSEEVSNGNGM